MKISLPVYSGNVSDLGRFAAIRQIYPDPAKFPPDVLNIVGGSLATGTLIETQNSPLAGGSARPSAKATPKGK